ncbi:MAG TPA: 4-hydroxy-tetrahydrodipicolinate reductase [Clostridia bacterium]|jgi:4-hydroxy-tetrahydrodipicolinate reductase|nr:4-hydroxy-tetrahydrodipicolinate reductase [Clostridia bacterium]
MNILLSGINGKMGKTIMDVVRNESDVLIVAGVDKNNSQNTYNIPVFESFKTINHDLHIDCIIDFSVKDAIYEILPFAIEHNISVVLATTGYDEKDNEYILNATKSIPILKSGNMSFGLNTMLKIVKLATRLLKSDADIEIIESHHNQKIDAPSGTALMIANIIQDESTDTHLQYGREGIIGKRQKNEIGMHSIRGGSVVGKHEVQFLLNGESITIKHEAESKSLFAYGSIKAAKFIQGKKPGLYTMSDLS